MKTRHLIAASLFCLSTAATADAPYIEHSTGFFQSSMPLANCLSKGQKAFADLSITLKSSTNPGNEVVGYADDFKIVLYCVSEEGGCDAPEEPYASGGTVIVAGPDYPQTKGWVDKVKEKLGLK